MCILYEYSTFNIMPIRVMCIYKSWLGAGFLGRADKIPVVKLPVISYISDRVTKIKEIDREISFSKSFGFFFFSFPNTYGFINNQ